MGKQKQYWLLKTEPGEWSWDDQASNGGISNWDGVKNKQAQKNLKAMKLNDLCFFYHSGSNARRVVGVVTVVKEWYDEGGEGVVDVKAVGEMRRPLDLKELKGDEGLKGFQLFRQPRLSVVPVSKEVWERVCELGGGFEGDGKDDGGDDVDGYQYHLTSLRCLRLFLGGKERKKSKQCLFVVILLTFGIVYVSAECKDNPNGLSSALAKTFKVDLFNGKGGLIEGCIERIDRPGLDLVALEDPKLVPPQSTQRGRYLQHLVSLSRICTLKGDRADWLVEKCALSEMIQNPPTKVGLLPLLSSSKKLTSILAQVLVVMEKTYNLLVFASQLMNVLAERSLLRACSVARNRMAIQLENLVQSIKSKVRALKKSKKPYIKMDKSASVKVEIRSRKARRLIDKTLQVADRPGKRTIS
ncbi:hypothetical protein POTOM_033088 [Populus tomentosa]|uniref:EVE domain-containing protein n=2 Tax=Populus TaxID=3689 RepID=A0A8X8CQD1_POPTO|nr:hypothetical protein POTOM_033088 [Populus tomentosa]